MSLRFAPSRAAWLSALVCLTVVAVSACSTVSIGYTWAPTLATWRADRYFDLTGKQRELFKERMERVLAWHRREALPEVIDDLRRLRALSEGRLTVEDGRWVVERVQTHYRVAVERIIDESAPLLPQLGPAQIAELERRLADDDAELAEHWIEPSPERVRKRRFERALDFAEDWVGPLEPAQRRWLQAKLDTIPPDYQAWRADRQRRQREFVELVRQGANGMRPVALMPQSGLKRWALDWDAGRTREQRERIDRMLDGYVTMWVELINGADATQRAHFTARIDDYLKSLASVRE